MINLVGAARAFVNANEGRRDLEGITLLVTEMADEIEKLRAEIEKLRREHPHNINVNL